MDPATAAGSGAGLSFVLALLNGWLASRRNRSGLLWFVASLILSPIALLFTIYLFAQPGSSQDADRGVAIAAIGVWALLLIVLLSVLLFGTSVGAGIHA